MTSSNQLGWDRKYTVKEADFHEKKLPDDIGVKWKDLARALGFNQAFINSTEKEKNYCTKECCIEVLVRWREREGKDATAQKLVETLVKIELKNVAERFPCKPSDPSQVDKLSARNKELQDELDKMSARNKKLEVEVSTLEARNKELEKRKQEEGENSSARIKELEEMLQKNKAVLETVAVAVQGMEKKTEQRRQESLRCINSEVQELLQQLKRVDVDNTDKCLVFYFDGKNIAKDKEPKNDLLGHDATVPQQDEVHLLQSCEEQLSLYQGIFDAFIELIPKAGELKDYNFESIPKLCNFTKELKEQEQLFSSKIESLNSSKDNLNEDQTAELEKLANWYQTHQREVNGLERLLSTLPSQGRSTKNQRSKPDSSKHSQIRRELQNISMASISAPFCPRKMCAMNTNKKSEEGQSVSSPIRCKSDTSAAKKPKKQNDETTRPASYSSPGSDWKDISSTENNE